VQHIRRATLNDVPAEHGDVTQTSAKPGAESHAVNSIRYTFNNKLPNSSRFRPADPVCACNCHQRDTDRSLKEAVATRLSTVHRSNSTYAGIQCIGHTHYTLSFAFLGRSCMHFTRRFVIQSVDLRHRISLLTLYSALVSDSYIS